MTNSKLLNYLSEESWLLRDDQLATDDLLLGSLFTIGNGYVASRGFYEEVAKSPTVGTYFAGLFYKDDAEIAQLLNAGNPFYLKIATKNETIDQADSRRTLDLQKGILHRQTKFHSLLDYESLRFISMADLNVAVIKVVVTSRKLNEQITIATTKHSLSKVQSPDNKSEVVFAEQVVLNYKGVESSLEGSNMTLTLEQDQPLTITKFITFVTSRDIANPKQREKFALERLKNAMAEGFEQIINKHCEILQKRWSKMDIQVIGDEKVQKALRFNLYHLLIAAHADTKDASIGAKMLTGEGYRGHIFWETELLLLPVYLFTEPKIAYNLLKYRFTRLSSALQISKQESYQGARYPWESADSGFDETPLLSADLDGSEKPVLTAKYALHINLAVFHGIDNYFKATNDVEFMCAIGLPMMIELSRFWLSRMSYDAQKERYVLENVMGPDEFHHDVNNNYYINKLVSWSFSQLHNLLDRLKNSYPEQIVQLLKNSDFTNDEQEKLKSVSERIFLPTQENLLIQFENYLALEEVGQLFLNEASLPHLPLKVSDLCNTQYIKQPEIILLFLLLPNHFNHQEIKNNFQFYNDRTLHKSSWSPPVTSAVAGRLGLLDEAYHYLNLTLTTDLENIFDNSHSGLHAPAVAGSWLAVVYGFLGVVLLEDRLVINPRLPEKWQEVSLKLHYLGRILCLKVDRTQLVIVLEPCETTSLAECMVEVGQIREKLQYGKEHRFLI